LLVDFMKSVDTNVIGRTFAANNQVDNVELLQVNKAIRNHPIESVGEQLRSVMATMKTL
jgi:ketol-acid reductoisomerase